jgi:hypothetical protein
MTGGLHGDPQAEGYGSVGVADLSPEERTTS